MSPAFLLTTLVVVVTPGTGVVHTLAAGLPHGRRTSVVAALPHTGAGMCAAAVRDRPTTRPRIMTGVRRVFAVCFVGLSARMAVA